MAAAGTVNGRWTFLQCFGLALGLLLVAGFQHLVQPVVPDWDVAADMLLVDQLREQGYQLTGHYSQYRFHHPGPFFVYLNWLAETLFLPFLPGRYNAWLLGSSLFNSGCIALTSVLLAPSGSRRSALLLTGGLVLLGQNLAVGVWMPERLLFPYAALLACLVVMGQGRLRWLPVAVVLVSVCIHGYASMPLFTLPPLALALWFGWRRAGFPGPGGWKPLRITVVLAALFALPLFIDALFGEPGNLQRALAAREVIAALPSAGWPAGLEYVLAYWVFQPEYWLPDENWLLAPLAVVGWIALWRFNPERLADWRTLGSLVLLVTALMLLYFPTIPAPLMNYTGLFYWAVPLLCILLPAVAWIEWGLDRYAFAMRPWYLATPALLLAMWFLYRELDVVSPRPFNPAISKMADEVEAHTADQGSIAIAYSPDELWEPVTGLLLELTRRGHKPCTLKQEVHLFTAARVCPPGTLPNVRLREKEHCGDRCGFTTDELGLQFMAVYPGIVGLAPGVLYDFGRIGTISGEGWANPEDWGRWSVGSRAGLMIPALDTSGVELDFDVRAYLAGNQQRLSVEVLVNGQPRSSWEFERTSNRSVRTVPLEPDDFANGAARLEFRIDQPTSPYLQGRSQDRRLLGIGILRLGVAPPRTLVGFSGELFLCEILYERVVGFAVGSTLQ